jgi:spore maturation protein CgeB
MNSKQLKIILVMGTGSIPSDSNQLFKNNIYRSLISMGHSIHLVHFDVFLASINESNKEIRKSKLEEHILDEYNTHGPFDYFLGFLSDDQVTPSLYQELKEKIFTINWTCNIHQFDTLHKQISPFIDLNTYISKGHKDLYDSVGATSFWLPMAASDEIYKPRSKKDIDISFIGSAYGNRPYYIWRLLQSNIPLKLFGPGWKFENNMKNYLRVYIAPIVYNFHNRVRLLDNLDKTKRINLIKLVSEYIDVDHIPNDEEYIEILSRSKVSLNFPESRRNNDYLNPEVTFGCNFRDFEIPLSGSMLMTQDSEELDYFYERDTEVITFGNETDMIDKARYYSSHYSEAEKIAKKGYKRAITDHTWDKRFNKLFEYLES